jgi:membrane-associated protein
VTEAAAEASDSARVSTAVTASNDATTEQSTDSHRVRRIVLWSLAAVALVVAVLLLWDEGQSILNGDPSVPLAYYIVAALVIGDALFPVLPGETTVNAACVLAANGQLDLIWVMVSGAAGAILGDSALYWLARKSRGPIRRRLDQAVDGKAGQTVIRMLTQYGAAFIVFGRYVPGLRFAINVTMGAVVRMPYRQFLMWSALSGLIWSVTTCLSAYFISSALDGYPILSLTLSTVVGTVLIGSCVWVRSRMHRSDPAAPPAVKTGGVA